MLIVSQRKDVFNFSEIGYGTVWQYANSGATEHYLKVGYNGCTGTNAINLRNGRKYKVEGNKRVIVFPKAEVYLNGSV